MRRQPNRRSRAAVVVVMTSLLASCSGGSAVDVANEDTRADEVLVDCGFVVSYETLSAAAPPDTDDPAFVAVQKQIGANPAAEFNPFGDSEVVVMDRTDDVAVFGVVTATPEGLDVQAHRAVRGGGTAIGTDNWGWNGFVAGGCELRLPPADGFTRVDWSVQDDPPEAATSLRLRAAEWPCAWPELEARLTEPQISESTEAISIRLEAVEAIDPNLDRSLECPADEGDGTFVTVDLESPIGTRSIVDGALLPVPDALAKVATRSPGG